MCSKLQSYLNNISTIAVFNILYEKRIVQTHSPLRIFTITEVLQMRTPKNCDQSILRQREMYLDLPHNGDSSVGLTNRFRTTERNSNSSKRQNGSRKIESNRNAHQSTTQRSSIYGNFYMRYQSYESDFTDFTDGNDVVINLDESEFNKVKVMSLFMFQVKRKQSNDSIKSMLHDHRQSQENQLKKTTTSTSSIDTEYLRNLYLKYKEKYEPTEPNDSHVSDHRIDNMDNGWINNNSVTTGKRNLIYGELGQLNNVFSNIIQSISNLKASIAPYSLNQSTSTKTISDAVGPVFLENWGESSEPSNRETADSLSNIDCITPAEARKRLNILLTDGTKENIEASIRDQNIRVDENVASSEEEFLSDTDNEPNVQDWTAPVPELRRHLLRILKKLNIYHPDYKDTATDMLYEYLKYVIDKRRLATKERILKIVKLPMQQEEKTNLLIQREIEDKNLNFGFYYDATEPPELMELCEKRKRAIYRKYNRCKSDLKFCENYFKRTLDQTNRPISQLSRKIRKLKEEMKLKYALM